MLPWDTSSLVLKPPLALQEGSSAERPDGDRAYKDVLEQALMFAKWLPLELSNISSFLSDMKLYSSGS